MECFLGVDDGFFKRSWKKTVIVVAGHCFIDTSLCPCFVDSALVSIDGLDSTEKVIELVKKARSVAEPRAVLLDTNIFAGFNVLDPGRLYRETGVPVIVVYWYPPSREAVREALRRHFDDWRERLSILEDAWSRLRSVSCSKGSLLVAPYGMGYGDAWRIVCSLQVYTRQPEPLFTAHVVASNLSRGLLSSGDA